MQSEPRLPLLWFLHKAPTDITVTQGAEPPWAREFALVRIQARHLQLGRFLCPLAGGPPAACVQANAALGTLPGNPEFWLYTRSDKKGSPLSPSQTIVRETNSHQPHIRSGIWKTQFRAFEEAGQGYFSSKF